MKNNLNLLLILACIGCATPMTQGPAVDSEVVQREEELQKELALKGYYKSQMRLLDISYPILEKNREACGKKVAPSFGLVIDSAPAARKGYEQVFKKLFGDTDDAKIVGIIEYGPAHHADVKVGDSVKAVGGEIYQDTSSKGMKKMSGKIADLAQPGSPVVFELQRDGQLLSTEITPQVTCDYAVNVLMDDALNAYADGKAVYVATGMMRFVEDDDELALIVGHEVSHNAMGHIDAKTRNSLLGTLFDIVAIGYGIDTQGAFGKMGANSYSREFESEADYVGLYYVARAGYDISEAPTFWRRMAIAHPDNIKGSYGATHPSTSERMVALENAVAEILTKQNNNQELKPNMKKE